MSDTPFGQREAWLERGAVALAPKVAASGYPMPPKVRYSCGWPARGRKAIGQCWSSSCSKDGTFEIFLSAVLADAARVLDVLLHEMIHAAVGLECGHTGAFRKVARECGLSGKLTATVASPELASELATLAATLGPYPHAELRRGLTNAPKKQGTRLLKAACPRCEYSVRVTKKWIDRGLPTCPCGTRMTNEGTDDAEGKDDD